ncbi:MAG TPA: 50S ribosomal protein L23 [bacterium]|nr:50S ribosomal protein L23 [bacterium]
MSLIDIFKKNNIKKKEIKKSQKVSIKKKFIVEKKKESKQKSIGDIPHKVLKNPHITEKATDLTEKNQYTFKIWPRANKIEVKKAIKDLYKVDVTAVKIINIPSKRKRFGKTMGLKKGYKKAIIKIKKGQKIEVLPR